MKQSAVLLGVFAAALWTAAPVAWAAPSQTAEAFTVTPYIQKASSERPVLHLVIRDAQAHSGVCDYTVTRFEYLRSLKAVVLNLDRGACLNDAYGKSEGDFYWKLPDELQNDDARICVSVNDGTPVALTYSGADGTYSVEDSQACTTL